MAHLHMDLNRLPTRGERIVGIIVSALVCLGTSAVAIPSVVIAITQPERANTGTYIAALLTGIIALWSAWKFVDFTWGTARIATPAARMALGIASALLGCALLWLILTSEAALARDPGLWAVTAVLLLGGGRAAWRAFRDHRATSS